MLPAPNRLRDSDTFRTAVRRGRRVAGPALVVHLLPAPSQEDPPRVGLIVPRSVGKAVTRNLVKRRLRHQLREQLETLPRGAVLVVRARPSAAVTSSMELGAELRVSLGRLLQQVSR